MFRCAADAGGEWQEKPFGQFYQAKSWGHLLSGPNCASCKGVATAPMGYYASNLGGSRYEPTLGRGMPKFSLTRWTVGLLALFSLQVLTSLSLHGFQQTLASDFISILVCSALFYACFLNLLRTAGPTRGFWELMAFGALLWLSVRFQWWHYEIGHREPVPTVFLGDVLAFLKNVPFMAALALQPHLECEDEPQRGTLDFGLLLLWWIYVYLFAVIPWQYISYDQPHYSANQMVLRIFQHTVLVCGMLALFLRTTNSWRRIYKLYVYAFLANALISIVLNTARARSWYHSGSIYDIFLVGSKAYLAWIAFYARQVEPWKDRLQARASKPNLWLPQLAMAAVISIPCITLWEMVRNGDHPRVRWFRLATSLIAMLVLTSLMFLKQHLMNLELARSLRASNEAIRNLRAVQGQLIQTEKLASLGRLVAGAAHEINNPLTAILGYSDLLTATEPINQEQKGIAEKIRQQARRTKGLVLNLLNFAKQGPSAKALLDFNSVISSAAQLRELDLLGQEIHIVRKLDPQLPPIQGDEYKLLQVCMHILNNAVDALKDCAGGTITIGSGTRGDNIFAEFRDSGPGVQEPHKIFDPFYTTKPVGQGTGLGLSASYGIIREHGGDIAYSQGEDGGAVFTITLPIAAAEEKLSEPSLSATD